MDDPKATPSVPPSKPQDRRVQRSRAALMGAAVRLVSERGTTSVPVTDLTEAADVSRKLLYMHFGDRERLFTEAARDLLEREVPSGTGEDFPASLRPQALDMARHFARHRRFYRPMLTGACAYAMNRTLHAFFDALNHTSVRSLYPDLDARTAEDLAQYLTGGASALVTAWVVDGPDPLDVEGLVDRLFRVAEFTAPALKFPPGGTPQKEGTPGEPDQLPAPAQDEAVRAADEGSRRPA
ncbi:TetR/AcrR family transcriptional regulator [Streptomyces sp. NPDC004539]|uniref:TetR/AcrR family transcriptional regulator n=1 Tax=Streptomyces sp. NPDC004539 TaxID=3154280 RepID=UPI00339F648D